MEHKTLSEITRVAQVVPLAPESARAQRTQRLERLATVLERHPGPIQLLSRIEHTRRRDRLVQRADNSPLTIAYCDPALREQGLASDRLGDAMGFFDLSFWEAHELFCDCHYARSSAALVAERARGLAHKQSWGERWSRLRRAVLGR